ncbi:MAG: hypothetical protein ABL897_02025 [Hyphomicrobium sp.]
MIWKSSKAAAPAKPASILVDPTMPQSETAAAMDRAAPVFAAPPAAASATPRRPLVEPIAPTAKATGDAGDAGNGTRGPGGPGNGGPGGNPFSHEPPDGHAKTMSAVLGELVWLMSQSPLHKQFFISDLEWPAAQAANGGSS